MGGGAGTPKQQISYMSFEEVEEIKRLPDMGKCVILSIWENHRAKGGFTPLIFRRVQSSPPDERKEGDSMVTYSDLIQTEIFIVALVGLCYTIFKGKKK